MTLDPLPFSSWLTAPAHQSWLAAEGLRLLEFARGSRLDIGFGALDAQGRLGAGSRPDTLITARMTHSFALAHLQGIGGACQYTSHGVQALAGPLRDAEHGGWLACADPRPDNCRKSAYLHAFVALAASSAQVAGRPGAQALLDEAIEIIERYFWSEEEGALRESFNRHWSEAEAYRGANSNMHATEAFLALADATGDALWLKRALRIVERVIHQHAAANGFMVIEHFDGHWQPLRDYNQANPADGFRPYGTTPGHGFEWARLLLHLEAALRKATLPAPPWLLEDARQLFDANCRHGWVVDGAPGIVYTLDWHNRPLMRQRLHWVHCEAIAAASALIQRTAERRYEDWYRLFWAYCEQYLLDLREGSWHHELDPNNHPGGEIWPGKPDLYHAWQALLIPRLPLAPSLATALAQQGRGANVTGV